MNLWDSNLSKQILSLFFSFILSQISEELEWKCVYPLKERKMLIKENWRGIIEKTLQLSRLPRSVYVANKHQLVNHTNSHTSLQLSEALSHSLSLLTSLTETSAPCLISVFTHSTDTLMAARWRGVWGKEVYVKTKGEDIILPFTLLLWLFYL